MHVNLQALANLSVPLMDLLQMQAASTVANQMGVQADALVEAVISDSNNNALPAIRPQNRTTAYPGTDAVVDTGYRLDSREQRFQAMHLVAGLIMANAGDKSLFVDATLQIRRSDTNKVLDYVVTLSFENGRLKYEEQLLGDTRDWGTM